MGLDAAATAIGISVADLRTELQAGKSLAQVAESKGVDRQKLIDALVADANAHIDEAVANGKLTSEQGATKKAGVADMVAKQVDNVHTAGERPAGVWRPR